MCIRDRRTSNAPLDQCFPKAAFHESGLVLRGIPNFDHDEMSVIVQTGGMGHKPIGPVPLTAFWVEAEFLVDSVVLRQRHTFEFQNQFSSHRFRTPFSEPVSRPQQPVMSL